MQRQQVQETKQNKITRYVCMLYHIYLPDSGAVTGSPQTGQALWQQHSEIKQKS